MNRLRFGVLGCGDFLRWNEPIIAASSDAVVTAVFDPDVARARAWAGKLDARVAESAAALIASQDVDAIALFVPPWARRDLLLAACAAGKHILTTKPLAPDVADCAIMADAVQRAGVRCGVIYNRTGSALIETLRSVFDSGAIGRLALYKHDWIHAYPRWNPWATDPVKNGGPFQDAMIHNLNAARYLMGRELTAATFFADRHSQEIPCADTETLKADFAGGGSAHLFITWAADLATYGTAGNDREHHDIFWLVTDQAWRVTVDGSDLVASRRGETRRFPLVKPATTVYDGFARAVASGAWPSDLPDLAEAARDIAIIRGGMAAPNTLVTYAKAASA